MPDRTKKKRELLAAELQRYFGEMCPMLMARWEAAIVGLAPPFLRELVGRLQELEEITDETSRQLEVALCPATEGGAPAEPVLDRALASLEHLSEVAEGMMRRLDELLTAA